MDPQPFEGFTLAPLRCPVYSSDAPYNTTLIHMFFLTCLGIVSKHLLFYGS